MKRIQSIPKVLVSHMRPVSFFTPVLAFLFFTPILKGALLVGYNFNTIGGVTNLSPTTTASNVSGSVLSGGSLGFATTTNTAFTSENLGLQNGTADNITAAIAADQYFSFTVTAASGFHLDLDSLTFDVGRAIRGAQDYAVRTSVDGFATNLVFVNQAITQTVSNQNITLGSPTFDGLTSIEFRIYFDDRVNNNNNSSGTFIDNLQINGTVVPEPSGVLFLGALLGSAALTHRRRRRSKLVTLALVTALSGMSVSAAPFIVLDETVKVIYSEEMIGSDTVTVATASTRSDDPVTGVITAKRMTKKLLPDGANFIEEETQETFVATPAGDGNYNMVTQQKVFRTPIVDGVRGTRYEIFTNATEGGGSKDAIYSSKGGLDPSSKGVIGGPNGGGGGPGSGGGVFGPEDTLGLPLSTQISPLGLDFYTPLVVSPR